MLLRQCSCTRLSLQSSSSEGDEVEVNRARFYAQLPEVTTMALHFKTLESEQTNMPERDPIIYVILFGTQGEIMRSELGAIICRASYLQILIDCSTNFCCRVEISE